MTSGRVSPAAPEGLVLDPSIDVDGFGIRNWGGGVVNPPEQRALWFSRDGGHEGVAQRSGNNSEDKKCNTKACSVS